MPLHRAILIGLMLFMGGCGTDSPPKVTASSDDTPAQPNSLSPPPAVLASETPKGVAIDDQRKDKIESPSTNAFNDPEKLTHDAIDVINNGDGDDWREASDELKIAACFVYSMQKTADLSQDGHVEMAKRYRDTLDDFYTQPDRKDKIIEILALTLTLDGQEWIKELRPEPQQGLTDAQIDGILTENRRVLGGMPDVNDRTVWTTIAKVTCPANEEIDQTFTADSTWRIRWVSGGNCVVRTTPVDAYNGWYAFGGLSQSMRTTKPNKNPGKHSLNVSLCFPDCTLVVEQAAK